MKALGMLLLVNVVIVAGYFLFVTAADTKKTLTFAAIGFAVGIGLIMGDRITGMKVPGVGELSAATDRAVAGAERIEAIQKEVEAHRDSITMIVRDANKAREDITRIDEYATTAKKKSEEAKEFAQNANDAQKTLRRTSDFNLLLTRANNDDRLAFEELLVIAKGNEQPYNEIAGRAVLNLATSNRGLKFEMGDSDWMRFRFDPKTATLPEFREFIQQQARSDLQAFTLDSLWQQERFTKRERIIFLIDIIKTTKSLHVLNDICQLLNQEAKIDKNILAWNLYVEWWDFKSATYK